MGAVLSVQCSVFSVQCEEEEEEEEEEEGAGL